MTNFQKYEKEIVTLLRRERMIAVVEGKPVECTNTLCRSCGFCHDDYATCEESLVFWLYKEAITSKKELILNDLNTIYDMISNQSNATISDWDFALHKITDIERLIEETEK